MRISESETHRGLLGCYKTGEDIHKEDRGDDKNVETVE